MNNWSVIATSGTAVGQVILDGATGERSGLAVDGAGDLYVTDTGNDRVQEYTASGGP
jgi:DNA-binding beta-propeller fold protein YncE